MNILFVLYQTDYDDSVWHALNLAGILFGEGNDVRLGVSGDSRLIEYAAERKLGVERILAPRSTFFVKWYQNATFKSLQSRFSPDIVLCYGDTPVGAKYLKRAEIARVVFRLGEKIPMFDNPDYLIATSEAVKQDLAKNYPTRRVTTLYGAVDTVPQPLAERKRRAVRKELKVSDGNILIGILGDMHEGSNHKLLMEALSANYHPNLKILVFADRGASIDEFKRLCRKYNILSAASFWVRERYDVATLCALDIGVILDSDHIKVAKRAIELIAANAVVIAASVCPDSELSNPKNIVEHLDATVLINTIVAHEKNIAATSEKTSSKELYLKWREMIN